MSSLPTLRKLVKAAGSEASEKNAIVKHLAQAHRYRRMPSITSSRNGSKVIRTYLWKDTPVGTIALVSGPSIDGQVFLVEAVQGNVSSDDVDLYIPATRRNPAYAAFKRNSAVRRQARYTAASSQGQWGRDYNYLNNPEENIKIPLNKVSLSVPRSALDLPSVSADLERCRTEGILYDASGRTYQIFYTVIATKRNGTGPILASNLPRSFGPTPGYPKVFQARSLRRATERNKITAIARDLDAQRVLLPHADPTFGAPVVWQGNGEGGTKQGMFYVLGGNSRTIALLMADSQTYAKYADRAKELWPDIWPDKRAPAGERYIVVRLVARQGCPSLRGAMALNADCQVSLKDAQGLAGATQQSMAGAETPLGEAVSLVRGLGLDDLGTDLPPIQFTRTIARDNVMEFVDNSTNARFLRKLRDTMGTERYEGMMGDVDNAAKLLNSVLIAFLPEVIIEQGFPTERQERAVMAMLAPLVTIVFGEKQGRPPIPAGFDLFPYLIDAKSVLEQIKNLSFKQTVAKLGALTRQQTLTSAGLGADTPVQALILGWLFKKAEKSRDPSIVVEKVLSAYVEAAMEAAQKYDTSQAGLFGASASGPMPASEPVQALLDAFLTIWTGRNEEAVQRLFEPMIKDLAPAPVSMFAPEPEPVIEPEMFEPEPEPEPEPAGEVIPFRPAPAPVGPTRYELEGETFTALPELKAGNLVFEHALGQAHPVLIIEVLGEGTTRTIQGLSSLGRYSERVKGRAWGADGWGEEKIFSNTPQFDQKRRGNQLGWQSWEQVRFREDQDLIPFLMGYQASAIRKREKVEAEKRLAEKARAEKYAAGPDFEEMADSLVTRTYGMPDTIEAAALRSWFKDNGVNVSIKVRRYANASGLDFDLVDRFSDTAAEKIEEMTDIGVGRRYGYVGGILDHNRTGVGRVQIKEPYVQQLKYILAKKAKDSKREKLTLSEAGKEALKAGSGKAKVKASQTAVAPETREVLAGQHRYIIEERDGKKGVYFGVVPLDRVERDVFTERRESAKAAGALGRGYFKAYRKGGLKGAFPFNSLKDAADWAATIWPGESVEVVTDEVVVEEIENLPVKAVEEVQATAATAQPEVKTSRLDEMKRIRAERKRQRTGVQAPGGAISPEEAARQMQDLFRENRRVNPYHRRNATLSAEELELLTEEGEDLGFTQEQAQAMLSMLVNAIAPLGNIEAGEVFAKLDQVAAIYRQTLSVDDTPESEAIAIGYESLSDAAEVTGQSDYAGKGAKIWYTRGTKASPDDVYPISVAMGMGYEWLVEQDKVPTYQTLNDTHILLGEIGKADPEKIFAMMQSEMWSPGPHYPANDLIDKKGLRHTSMKVGDIIEMDGKLIYADKFGFKELKAPAPGDLKPLTYEEWKTQMQKWLTESMEYGPGQVGGTHFAEKMAVLADEYPNYEARFDKESAASKPKVKKPKVKKPRKPRKARAVVEAVEMESPTRENILAYLEAVPDRTLTSDMLVKTFSLTDGRAVGGIFRGLLKEGRIKETSGVWRATLFDALQAPLVSMGDTRGDLLQALQLIFSGAKSDDVTQAARALTEAIVKARGAMREKIVSRIAEMTALCNEANFAQAIEVAGRERGTLGLRNALNLIGAQRFPVSLWVRSTHLSNLGSGNIKIGSSVKVKTGEFKGSTGVVKSTTHSSNKAEKKRLQTIAKKETGTDKAKLVEFGAAGGKYADLAKQVKDQQADQPRRFTQKQWEGRAKQKTRQAAEKDPLLAAAGLTKTWTAEELKERRRKTRAMLDAKWKAHDEDMAVKADLYRKALEQYLPAEEVEEMEAYRKRLQMPEKPVHHASWWHNKLREYGLRPFDIKLMTQPRAMAGGGFRQFALPDYEVTKAIKPEDVLHVEDLDDDAKYRYVDKNR